MRLTLVHPPYPDQPDLFGVRVSDLLLITGAAGYNEFKVATAFVRLSGVARLDAAISSLRGRGGKAVLVAGVDMRGTTYQGLDQALTTFDEVYVYNDSDRQRTFHPKLFILKNASSAVVLVGSNNLTMGGLYTNYELAVLIDLDLLIAADRAFLADVEKLFAKYCKSAGKTKRLSQKVLQKLLKDGLLADETRPDPRPKVGGARQTAAALPRARSPFAAPPPMPTKFAKLLQRKLRTTLRPIPPSTPQPSQLIPGQASGFWKRLSANDVSTTSSPGQMIIPKDYVAYFPPLLPTANPHLRESNLSTEFIDRNGMSTPAPDSRLILYVPKPGHKRPNIEYRFTFHDRSILSKLNAGDVLVFEPQPAPYQFRVWQVAAETPAASNYVGRDGII